LTSPNGSLPAIVLAGAPAEPDMAEMHGIVNRADLPIAGRTMIQRIVDALIASANVGEIVVIGDAACSGDLKRIESRGSLIDNLIAGAETCAEAARMLVCTSDIPAATAETIDDFVGRCADYDADFFYPIVTKEDSERRFPGVKRTYAKMAEGTFTGGNIMLFSRRFILENGDTIRSVAQNRKSILGLARLLGIGVLLRVVLAQAVWPGAITLADLEKVAGRILGAQIKAVTTPMAEIAADVDNLEQAADIERCM